jgi:hypothetical protein
MSYSVDAYILRAEECVRLANLAVDDLIRNELLNLRQTYLRTAERLRQLSVEASMRAPNRNQPSG